MKGGLQFINPDDTIELNTLSLYGDDKNLKYKKIEVQTNLNLVDGKPLKFTLYNINSLKFFIFMVFSHHEAFRVLYKVFTF